MLSSFRKASKSWLAKGLMLTLVAAFGLWGINDIFRGGSTDTSVASVGGRKIEADDFNRELRSEMKRESQQMHTEITLEQAHTLGLGEGVLNQMISRAALDNEVARLGLTVSNTRVANEIRSNKQLQGQDGAFSRPLLDSVLQQNGITEATFEDSMQHDLARAQLMEAPVDGFAVPPMLTHLLYDYVSQTRTTEYLVMTPDMAGNPPAPTDAELGAYYKANAARFSTPEYRQLDYVAIGPSQFSDKVQVTDADVKKEYDEHLDQYVKPESREIEQIKFPSQADAMAAQQKLAAGSDFISLAHGVGMKDEDVKLGAVTKSGLDAKLADAIFAQPVGGMTPPIQSPFGWVIVRVTKITPGENKTFDQLKGTLHDQLAKARAMGQVIDAANKFEDTRGGGASLDQAAGKLGLEMTHVASVNKNGLAPDGSKVNLPADPAFLAHAFSQEAGEDGDTFESADHTQSFAVKVVGITPPAVKPLDQVRDEAVKGWTAEKRVQMLADRAKALFDQAQKENSLASAAKALGRQPTASPALKRDATSDVFVPQLLERIFAVPPGAVVAGPLAKGEGFVIVRVINVQHPVAGADPANLGTIARATAQQVAGSIVQTLAASARETEGATINQASFDRVFGANNE